MKHARPDYDAIQPFPTKRPHIVKIDGETVDASEDKYLGKHMEPLIPDDEPVLLIRGQDMLALPTLDFYIKAASAGVRGGPPDRPAAWAPGAHRSVAARREGEAAGPARPGRDGMSGRYDALTYHPPLGAFLGPRCGRNPELDVWDGDDTPEDFERMSLEEAFDSGRYAPEEAA